MTRQNRHLTDYIVSALKNHPVVFLNGPRQAGKSTLAQMLSETHHPAEYITFDNATQMAAATSAPESFLSDRTGPIIIDEVQMVPDIFRPLKQVVDQQRLDDKGSANGRFLLTGSANLMVLPNLSDALVGRISVKTLYPYSASEALQQSSFFLENLFSLDFPTTKKSPNLSNIIQLATFPDISGKPADLQHEWFENYITTLLQRDVRAFYEIEKLGLLPIQLRALATRAGHLLNDADIARDIGLNAITSRNYRQILSAMFLTLTVEPWFRNLGKRLVKSSKGYITDTPLLCFLLGLDVHETQHKQPHLYGRIVENFVASELTKQLSYSDIKASIYHFRTADNKEVDFVLERPNGSLAGIEVKTRDRVEENDFKGLKALQAFTGEDFSAGIVLYAGNQVVRFGKKLYAVPLAMLWQ